MWVHGYMHGGRQCLHQYGEQEHHQSTGVPGEKPHNNAMQAESGSILGTRIDGRVLGDNSCNFLLFFSCPWVCLSVRLVMEKVCNSEKV